MKLLLGLLFSYCLFSISAFGQAENMLLSMATTDKKLILLNVSFSNNKFTVVDSAVFTLPFQAGLTAIGHLENGNYQIVWTAMDAAQKIKLNSMNVDADLNRVTNNKKFGPFLTGHFNMNVLNNGIQSLKANAKFTEGSYYSVEMANNVVLRDRNRTNGNLSGPVEKFFTPPNGFDPFDTNFAPDDQGYFYGVLGFDEPSNRYAVLFGNTENANFTSAFRFTGIVVNGAIVKDSNEAIYNYLLMERFNNPERYKILNGRVNENTGQVIGNPIVHSTPKAGNLDSLAFFNGISARRSDVNLSAAYVFFVADNLTGEGNKIGAYRMSTDTGKRNTPITWLSEIDVGSQNLFKYALANCVHPLMPQN